MAFLNLHKKKILFAVCLSLFFLPAAGTAPAQEVGQSYALLIGGSGGSEEYSSKYQLFLLESRKALIENFQFPEPNVIVLAESRSEEEDFVTDISRAENIRAQFAALSKKVTKNDHVYIILFGHGTYDGRNSKFNIPGLDVKDTDFAELVGTFDANRVVFINTTELSFSFIGAMSAENRIIITATRSDAQRYETRFPEYFIEALQSPESDLDKNGNLSLLEIFKYAAERTARWFEAENHVPTEHSLLEDTGDKMAFRIEELEANAEGNFSETTYLKRRAAVFAATMSSAKDSMIVKYLLELERLEQEISTLKSNKNQFTEEVYYAQLEVLLVQLALINDEIDKIKENL